MSRAVAVLVVAATGGLAAQEPQEYRDTHPPSAVTVRQESGAALFEATVPGTLVDWAAQRSEDGRRELFLLAAPEDDEAGRHALFRVDLDHRRLTRLASDLSPDLDRLAAVDIDGDGTDELLLGRPGLISTAAPLDGSGPLALTELFSAPGVDLAADLPVRGAAASTGHLSIPSVGLMRHLAPQSPPLDSARALWGLTSQQRLPKRASRHRYGLRLTTTPSTLLRLESGDVYAVGPEAAGHRRLRSTLLPADAGETPGREAWSRLPSPERVQWSWFHVLDDRPVLIVTTNSADKLGIFERQQLRLFSLYADRTQAGVGPWLTAQTTSRRWQRVEPFVVDVEGDGDDDLVVAQLDGLGDGKVKFEAFINSGERRFEAKTRSTVLPQSPGGWHFGTDLTGDGLGDLLLHSEGSLMVYETLAGDSRRLLAKRPQWTFSGPDIPRVERSVEIGTGGVAVTDERPGTTGRPTTIDLDGDGRPELLLAENPQWGFGRLRIVFLPPPRGARTEGSR